MSKPSTFDYMQLPFFYVENIDTNSNELVLDEDNSRHIISVLRMQEGEALHITDGKGNLLTATISDPHKKKCRISITGRQSTPVPLLRNAIAISLVKNPVRFEWFLEKSTEVGITEIIPMICTRTEKQHFRLDRMKHVLVSALLQSRQTWLPILHQPVKFEVAMGQDKFAQKFIAHCLEENKKSLRQLIAGNKADSLILIGPEGDFTPVEISVALQKGFVAVTLGETRLRTETAGMAAAVLLQVQ